jgi:uncharacterized protein YaeQ
VGENATIYHYNVEVSNVDRGVYETLDLRLARHPSESMPYLVTRTLAYALCFEEGIAFSKGGVSSTHEPPVAIHDAEGNLRTWIDVGTPSAERLHRASKAAQRVVVFTHHDPELLLTAAAARPIYRAEHVEIYAVPPDLLDAMAEQLDAHRARWSLLCNDNVLFVTIGDQTLSGTLTKHALAPERD